MGFFDIGQRSTGYPRPVGYIPSQGSLSAWAKLDHVHDIHVESWTKLELDNGWTHVSSNPLKILKDPLNFVHISGAILPGTLLDLTVLTTLPVRFWHGLPGIFTKSFFVRVQGSAAGWGTVRIYSDGTLKISIGAGAPIWTGAVVVEFESIIYEVNPDAPDAV